MFETGVLLDSNNLAGEVLKYMNQLVENTNEDVNILPGFTLELLYHNSTAVVNAFTGLQNSKWLS